MLEWILNNWDTVFAVIGILGTVCTTIVTAFSKVSWLSYVVKACDWLSVVNTAENKAKLAAKVKK